MSILRKLTITALAAGSLVSVPAAAFASPAPASHSPAAAAGAIRRVPCRSSTFDVYTTRGMACYEGTGTIRLHVRDVREITAGRNAGDFELQRGHAYQRADFGRYQAFLFRPPYPELVLLQINVT